MIKRDNKSILGEYETDLNLKKYVPPKAIRMGALNEGMGNCEPGSSAADCDGSGFTATPNSCQNSGITASDTCQTNGGTAANCEGEGSSASVKCEPGSYFV